VIHINSRQLVGAVGSVVPINAVISQPRNPIHSAHVSAVIVPINGEPSPAFFVKLFSSDSSKSQVTLVNLIY
jgi:hypothetical protein